MQGRCYRAMGDVLKPPGSLPLIVLRRWFRCNSYLMLFGVGFCRIFIAPSVVNDPNVNL